MKKWHGGSVIVSLFVILMLRYLILDSPLAERSLRYVLQQNSTTQLHWLDVPNPPAVHNPQNSSQVISTELLASSLSITRNLSDKEMQSLRSWNHLRDLVSNAHILPDGLDAIKEAGVAWRTLNAALEHDASAVSVNDSTQYKDKEKQCPYSIRRMNATSSGNRFVLKVPCGLIQGSSITIIGTPGGLLGNFKIDLTGVAVPGEPDPPIVLHYNVRLFGDKLTEDPVIVQNTWTIADDWGSEDRCPSSGSDAKDNAKVDDLEKCSSMVGNEQKQILASKLNSNFSRMHPTRKKIGEPKKYYPFKQGYLAIAILRVGAEGIHMTVDGKHVTSFAFREDLEPGFVGEVRIAGDIKLLSLIASGLPTTEDFEHVTDLAILKAPPVPMDKFVDLFIGIFSTANNFKRRMAVRRTWMQYDAVRSGKVVVRFFVGLHKNEVVNEELWNEARTYGDIQLMPFVDYYSLILWKTIAICIYGTNVLSAKYVMKTDDDAFVRVDEILSSLHQVNISHGLLYGRVNSDSQPHRDPYSKWYITSEEWPEESYPPWAHGPGYIVSQDIAKEVYRKHKRGELKMFKLEDVAMGIWINEMKKEGLDVKYENDGRILVVGCEDGYVVAHYQEPRQMMCLWDKIQKGKRGICCNEYQ
ncbi:beta-1,3-galactosyltransferase GALT1 isoform X1 [Lolium perenne]|uniref:beta-1,3-galactosyltransferase GALT1 isoform X1 n=1 Tax=Lolium perenne TaxID=4522 RepID=UPI0021F5CD1A|nr:beta-1,3-galactosyltransferase GALT1 isoform X1 [Lolium perenne]XP_051204080.1 beta-1,3-galactosyltransferase GALT1 isoform X1 [Lolium perenne]